MPVEQAPQYPTPYEAGNRNQTTTWAECIAFYERLANDFPSVLRWQQIGTSDNGIPMHAGIVTTDAQFDRETLQRQRRPIFFNNNGIHPGEPEGIDACMALVRDFCTQPARLAALGSTVFLFIPVYNVDGCLNRQSTSRANQLGPESFGFRGNARHLDLNRDFIKCDSLAAQVFNRFFTAWDPDVMVDTHTSNGADYAYTMTLIPTQPDKLGGGLGQFLRSRMLPAIYGGMDARGWPTCPYVNCVAETPDEGIADFLDMPRFSTGYAALHHTIGFMPETHMLKPYADRVAAMRTLVEVVLDFTVAHAARIQELRRETKAGAAQQTRNGRCRGVRTRANRTASGSWDTKRSIRRAAWAPTSVWPMTATSLGKKTFRTSTASWKTRPSPPPRPISSRRPGAKLSSVWNGTAWRCEGWRKTRFSMTRGCTASNAWPRAPAPTKGTCSTTR
jgi:hypothetical protein